MKKEIWKKVAYRATVLSILLSTISPVMGQAIGSVPDMEKFRQALKEVRRNTTVMIIALRPGEEDLKASSYFRYRHGARVIHAFITNGEAGNPDGGTLYPHELAVRRKIEGDSAARALGAEAWFLNFSDYSATPSEGLLQSTWQAETLRVKMARLISITRPNIIVVCRDPLADSTNRLVTYVEDALLSIAQESVASLGGPGTEKALPRWSIEKIFGPSLKEKGWIPPSEKRLNPANLFSREYERKANASYRVQAKQREQWFKGRASGYSQFWPRDSMGSQKQPIEFQARISKRMQGLQRRVVEYCDSLGLVYRKIARPDYIQYYDRKLLSLLKEIDMRFSEVGRNLPADRRLLEGWREGLLRVRQHLFGIEVKISQSETILTNVQLAYVVIDTIIGLPLIGETKLYISDASKGWILNETLTDHITIRSGEKIRLLSPGKNLRFNFPLHSKGLNADRIWEDLPLTIIHTGPSIEESFLIHHSLRFMFSEKIDIEPLRPILRLQNGEKLPLLLINHSRDGVYGKVSLRDSLIESTEVNFRLRSKEDRWVDTLTIKHFTPIADTTFLIPVVIDGLIVSAVAGRAFTCLVDSLVSVSVFTAFQQSTVTDAVRSIGIHEVGVISQIHENTNGTSSPVIIADCNVFSDSNLSVSQDIFRYAEQGGHVILLSQDLSILKQWQKQIDFPISLSFNTLLDTASFFLLPESPFLQFPNRLSENDFQGFILRKMQYRLHQPLLPWEVPLQIQNGSQRYPGILTRKYGKGRITYCNLALPQQWLNIHPGSLRFLANLIAWKNGP